MTKKNVLMKQQYFQSVNKLTYLKGPRDKFTSILIPSVYAATVGAMVVRGLWNMAHGTGKKE
eukprot:c31290_g1_i1 orf=306-491(+)